MSVGKTPKDGGSLADVYPEIAAQANGWDAFAVTPKSNKNMSWKCARGHVWDSAVNNRTAGNGCPYCSGRKVLVGENDLATVNPALAVQAYGWDPSQVSQKSNTKRMWKCPKGHIFDSTVNNRSREGSSGCPICSGHRVLKGFNDLVTTDPALASEAFGWDPTTVTRGSGFRGRWRCTLGHEWTTTVSARTTKGRGCSVCANQTVLPGYNDLGTIRPDLATEAYGWDPATEVSGSKRKKMWRCPSGHIYEASLSNRSKGRACPFCAGKKVLVGFNDLATISPTIAAEAHRWDPTTVTVSSAKVREWVCRLGHVFTAAVYSRQTTGCQICAIQSGKPGKQVVVGYNDLASADPGLAAEAYGWDPATVTRYSPKKVQWRCSLGHIYSAAINNRSGGKGCSYCSGQRVLAGFNDFASQFPHLAHQADGWDPRTVTKASGIRKPWICDLGHKWRAPTSDRSHGQGCPSCAKSGFDPNKDGYLYLIEHDIWQMLQIGITNNPKRRLREHGLIGWTALEVRGPMDGHLTSDLETGILRSLKARGAVFANKTHRQKFDGWSEAWLVSTVPVSSIKELLDLVYEDD
jgi:hypothetical protein